jgi:hypothetical protein
MSFYDEFVDLVKELFTEFDGELITVQEFADVENPDAPWDGPSQDNLIKTEWKNVRALWMPAFGREFGGMIQMPHVGNVLHGDDLFKQMWQMVMVEPFAEGCETRVDRLIRTDGSTWTTRSRGVRGQGQVFRTKKKTIMYFWFVSNQAAAGYGRS